MIRVATRDSLLSLTQTKQLIDELKVFTDQDFELLPLKTLGDKNITDRFEKIGGKGIFTKELDLALLEDRADIAIHSLKDLPSIMPKGIALSGIGHCIDPSDAWVSTSYKHIGDVPSGGVVGTSSARRVAQLASYYPKITVVPMRGNLQTRLKKMQAQKLDGVLLAASGLKRMGYEDQIQSCLDTDQFVPAIGQGHLAITSRSTSSFDFIHAWQSQDVMEEALSLRYIMEKLEGGCSVPLGAIWRSNPKQLTVFVSSRDASSKIIETIEFDQTYLDTAKAMLLKLESAGAKQLIEECKHG